MSYSTVEYVVIAYVLLACVFLLCMSFYCTVTCLFMLCLSSLCLSKLCLFSLCLSKLCLSSLCLSKLCPSSLRLSTVDCFSCLCVAVLVRPADWPAYAVLGQHLFIRIHRGVSKCKWHEISRLFKARLAMMRTHKLVVDFQQEKMGTR